MADRVLVAYASKFGSTAEIAQAVGATLRTAGFEVDVKRAKEVRSLAGYRAAVVGSAVYMARWRREAVRLLRRRRHELAERDVWLFSSGPVAQPDTAPPADAATADRWTRPKRVEELASEIGAHEHVVFGGSVSDDRGGFVRKSMAAKLPADRRDDRDWHAIEAWAKNIATELTEHARAT